MLKKSPMSRAPSRSSTVDAAGSCRSSISSTDAGGDDKSCAIKVVIRARPLSTKELLSRTPVAVSVSRSCVQVVNPVMFTDPSYLEAISSSGRRASVTNLPIALSPAGLKAAQAAGECRAFHFDRCFGASVPEAADPMEISPSSCDIDSESQRPNQELIFDELGQDMISSAFEGFNCTVLAYGQTGSGKTHTMVGDESDQGKGVIPRVCEALFQEIEARRAKEGEVSGIDTTDEEHEARRTIFSAHVSYCEIYKEKVNDLLDTETSSTSTAAMPTEKRRPSLPPLPHQGVSDETSASGGSRRALRVREHPVTGPFVEGLSSRSVTSYEDIAEEMLAGEKLRTVASTLMNPVSSRSHAVFTITFTQTTFDPASQCANDKTSKICMIDLAGSERANVSGTSGDRLKEGAMINKSLTTLGRVISALSKQASDRIPYRDSTLTWLLKESLGGNARTTMIAMISPSSDNYEETMSTLRYAESAKKVMNRAVVNEDRNARIIRQLRQEIDDLRDQLAKKGWSPRKDSANAGLSASLVERETFYAQLQQEVEFFRSQQAQVAVEGSKDQQKKVSAFHLDSTLPSLVNASDSVGTGQALAYLLLEGTSVFGSEPEINESGCEVAEESAKEDIKATPSEDNEKTVSPKKKRGSWSSTFTRRRSYSSRSAPSTPSPTRCEDTSSNKNGVSAAAVIQRLGEMQVCQLQCEDEGDVFPRHARFTCTRTPQKGALDAEASPYEVEVMSLNPSAVVLVNGRQLEYGEDTTAKLRHGDLVQLGRLNCFRLHVPGCSTSASQRIQEAAQSVDLTQHQSVDQPLEALVAEANAICTRWLLNTEFAIREESEGGEREGSGDKPVIVKKKLDSNYYSVVHWDRTTFESKLQFLRGFAASLESEDAIWLGAAEHDGDKAEPPSTTNIPQKIAASRPPGRSSDREEDTHPDDSSHFALECREASRPASNLRLLGHGRIFLAALPSGLEVAVAIAIFNFLGQYLGKLEMRLQGASATTSAKKKTGVLDLFSPKRAASSRQAVQIHLDRMEFDATSAMSAAGISVTLKEISTKDAHSSKKSAGKGDSCAPNIFSTPRVPPAENEKSLETGEHCNHEFETPTFEIGETFETALSTKSRGDQALFSGDSQAEHSLLAEIWGYDVVLASPATRISLQDQSPARPTRQIEFYVSVDAEEREQDGLYRPVAVKNDGSLRFHANRARRLIVRVVQSDRQPFALLDIVRVRVAPTASHSVENAASSSKTTGKTIQWALSPTSLSRRSLELTGSRSETTQDPATACHGSAAWQTLEFRGDCEVQRSSRSLNATLKWDQTETSAVEYPDHNGERSVYRLVIAFTTHWSNVPVVVSKSLVAKVCPSSTSATQKLAREMVTSRTAWWARESFSRSYRLGTWYAADVTIRADDTSDIDPTKPANVNSDDKSTSVTDAAVAHHICGLHSLDMAMQLERIRQKIWIMLNTRVNASSTDGSTAAGVSDASVTAVKVTACLDEMLETNDYVVQAFESVFLNSRCLIRQRRRQDLLMDVYTGQLLTLNADRELVSALEDESSCENPLCTCIKGHMIHFVSEPTQLVAAGEAVGDMSGFLMLSLSSALDEATAAAVVAPLDGSTPQLKASTNLESHHPARASWERRWFVLKRPFLYAYESHAQKQQTGVMDVSACQLLASPVSSIGASQPSRRLASSSTSLDVPFSFRLVCLAGRKTPVVWWLQASTAAEMRAWLVAIDPLKIEARQALASAPSETETLALTA